MLKFIYLRLGAALYTTTTLAQNMTRTLGETKYKEWRGKAGYLSSTSTKTCYNKTKIHAKTYYIKVIKKNITKLRIS